MLTNTWFLVGCVVFGIAGLVAIIAGAATSTISAIVIGTIVLIACAWLFYSGMIDRKHLTPGQRRRVPA